MKTVLVTGGGRGIGAATVRKFAENNYSAILNYNNSESCANQLRSELASAGLDVHLFRADISDVRQVVEMFAYIRKYFKKLDILVNNAGVALYKQCQDVTVDDYDKIMNINAKGTFLCCQEAIKMFLQQGYGSIVNVASIWGTQGASCESVYSMSKHAVVGLTKSLALELEPSGINVNCICPTLVLTDMCKHLSQQDVNDFCLQHNVQVESVNDVANNIYQLAISEKTGIIV